MTAHELAKKLLELPDLEVYVREEPYGDYLQAGEPYHDEIWCFGQQAKLPVIILP